MIPVQLVRRQCLTPLLALQWNVMLQTLTLHSLVERGTFGREICIYYEDLSAGVVDMEAATFLWVPSRLT